jgi:hypothetical protein
MNLHALYELRNNNPDAITDLAESLGHDPVVAMGVAILLLANDGNLASLSPKQQEHYEAVIKPLLG